MRDKQKYHQQTEISPEPPYMNLYQSRQRIYSQDDLTRFFHRTSYYGYSYWKVQMKTEDLLLSICYIHQTNVTWTDIPYMLEQIPAY